MDEKLASALKALAFFIGGFAIAVIVTFVLLFVSMFREVDLLTAFLLQFLSFVIGGFVMIWRVS